MTYTDILDDGWPLLRCPYPYSSRNSTQSAIWTGYMNHPHSLFSERVTGDTTDRNDNLASLL